METATQPGTVWWRQLTPEWKQALAEAYFHHSGTPAETQIRDLFETPALRLTGPEAPYPNMSVKLKDLSGLKVLTNLEVLVVTHHGIETINELSGLYRMKSLFVHNNRLTSLNGVESMRELEQLYAQCNQIGSLAPVQSLIHLKQLYVSTNLLTSLDGLTEEHADTLEMFICKPNQSLKQKEMLRVERELGIRCKGG